MRSLIINKCHGAILIRVLASWSFTTIWNNSFYYISLKIYLFFLVEHKNLSLWLNHRNVYPLIFLEVNLLGQSIKFVVYLDMGLLDAELSGKSNDTHQVFHRGKIEFWKPFEYSQLLSFQPCLLCNITHDFLLSTMRPLASSLAHTY